MKNFIFTILLTLFITGCAYSNEQINNGAIGNIDDVNNQAVQVSKDEIPTKPIEPKLKALDCKAEQRNVDGCIEIYQPVCGQVQIQCITTPCDPVRETFENSCNACTNPNVLSYTEGKCPEADDAKR